MKTKIGSYHIDLTQVSIIGPLVNDQHNGAGLGCSLTIRGQDRALWLSMCDDKIDPYQIDETKNAMARMQAQANYTDLVERWEKTE